MMIAHSSNNLWHWLYIVSGIAMLVLLIDQARFSLATGLLQFSSRKYGFAFLGTEAVVIYVALILGASFMIGIGWRGLRHGREGT